LKIAIIGGGIGGLATAYFLEQKNKDLNIKIFEGNDRLGGRILTRQFNTVPIKYNAGVAELYDILGEDEKGNDNLENMVDFLKIPKIEIHGFPMIAFGDLIIKNKDDIYKTFGKETADKIYSFIKLGKKFRKKTEYNKAGSEKDNNHPWFIRRFEDVLNDIKDEKAKHFLQIKVHCDLATEPEKTNGTFAFDNILIDESEYLRMYTLKGTNETLIKRLYTKLSSTKTYLESPVYGVNKNKSGYELTIRINKKKTIKQVFDVVVIATAHPCLKKIEFSDELKQKMENFYNHYDFDTHYLRATLLFEDTFWRKVFNESYFILDSFGGCCVYDQSEEGYGILSWLISGENALKLNPMQDNKIIEKVLNSLPAIIKTEAKEKFLEGKIDRWMDSVSRQPGGTPILPMIDRHFPDKENNPNLLVVGDYLTDTTVNGSLLSAKIVAKQIIE